MPTIESPTYSLKKEPDVNLQTIQKASARLSGRNIAIYKDKKGDLLIVDKTSETAQNQFKTCFRLNLQGMEKKQQRVFRDEVIQIKNLHSRSFNKEDFENELETIFHKMKKQRTRSFFDTAKLVTYAVGGAIAGVFLNIQLACSNATNAVQKYWKKRKTARGKNKPSLKSQMANDSIKPLIAKRKRKERAEWGMKVGDGIASATGVTIKSAEKIGQKIAERAVAHSSSLVSGGITLLLDSIGATKSSRNLLAIRDMEKQIEKKNPLTQSLSPTQKIDIKQRLQLQKQEKKRDIASRIAFSLSTLSSIATAVGALAGTALLGAVTMGAFIAVPLAIGFGLVLYNALRRQKTKQALTQGHTFIQENINKEIKKRVEAIQEKSKTNRAFYELQKILANKTGKHTEAKQRFLQFCESYLSRPQTLKPLFPLKQASAFPEEMATLLDFLRLTQGTELWGKGANKSHQKRICNFFLSIPLPSKGGKKGLSELRNNSTWRTAIDAIHKKCNADEATKKKIKQCVVILENKNGKKEEENRKFLDYFQGSSKTLPSAFSPFEEEIQFFKKAKTPQDDRKNFFLALFSAIQKEQHRNKTWNNMIEYHWQKFDQRLGFEGAKTPASILHD